MTEHTRLILPPGVKHTPDQLTTVHPWDRPGFTPDHLDAEDRVAYWARRHSQLVTINTVSEEVFLTAQAAERIRNNRAVARTRLGMPQAEPLPKDDPTNTAAVPHAGLQLLDESSKLIVLDEVAPIDEAVWAQLKADLGADKLARIDAIGVEELEDPRKGPPFGGVEMHVLAVDELNTPDYALLRRIKDHIAESIAVPPHLIGRDHYLHIDKTGAVEVLDPADVLVDGESLTRIVPEPQAATLDQVLAMEPEEGELSDREILQSLRAKGADVKIKGKSPAPVVTRKPEFNPIDELRKQHLAYNATRMNPLAHAVKIGCVSIRAAQDPPWSLPPGFTGAHA